ncbi:hypothetical protein LEN26_008984 [Aphanomyces euteiches]|nr:hypothetical protein AeMF1_004012 [Aphanomyces euteiches]KAH9129559.1 hypothetical protein LEN26_008984 [Aphanomyces euteiches]KAH9188087.1 hypothetical protein AeNC1_009935 [Aphanomyces euteiches]
MRSLTALLALVFAAGELPSQVLNLSIWSLDTPEDNGSGNSRRVYHPALDKYDNKYLSVPSAGDKFVQLLVPVNGKTTPNSHYPRTEFREVKPNGKGSGDNMDFGLTGSHRLDATLAVMKLPPKRPGTAVGQLFGDGPCVMLGVKKQDNKYKISASNHFDNWKVNEIGVLDADYKLGTKFSYSIAYQNGKLTISYNGKTVINVDYKEDHQCNCKSGSDALCYFKAGNYLQTNTDYDNANDVGIVNVYSLSTKHSS